MNVNLRGFLNCFICSRNAVRFFLIYACLYSCLTYHWLYPGHWLYPHSYFLSSQDLFTAEKNSRKQKSARFLSRFQAKTPLAVCRWLTLHIRSLSAQPGPSYKNPVKRPKNPSGNSPKKLQYIDLARAKSEVCGSCWIMASVTCTPISRPISSEDTAGMSKSSRCFQVLLTFSLTSLCGGTFNLGTVHTGWMWTGMFTACFPVGVIRRFTDLEHCGVPLFSMFPRQCSRSGPSWFSLSAMSLLIKVSELPSSRIANVSIVATLFSPCIWTGTTWK